MYQKKGVRKDYFLLGRWWGEGGGECTYVTQTHPASNVQGCDPCSELARVSW